MDVTREGVRVFGADGEQSASFEDFAGGEEECWGSGGLGGEGLQF